MPYKIVGIQIEGQSTNRNYSTRITSGSGKRACPRCFCRSAHFSVHFPRQHQPDHFVVADEGPQRILKRGRPVFLNEEVADPGGAVTRDKSEGKKPPPSIKDEESETAERDRSSNEVEHTRERLTVFGDIVWPKFSKGVVLTLGH